jgi:hypothetical protein
MRPAKITSSGVFRLYDFAALIITTCFTDVVGSFQFAAIRTFLVNRGRQGIVCPAHVAARLGSFFLRDCHR